MFKKLWSFIRDEVLHSTFHVLVLGAWPIFSSVSVAMIAFLEHYTWTPIILCTVATFGFVSWGMYYFQQLVFQRSTAGKLRHVGLSLVYLLDQESNSGHVRYIKVRLHLDSIAVFPMQFQVEKISTQLAERVNSKKYENTNALISVSAAGTAWYADSEIDLKGVDQSKAIEGTFEYLLKYGRPGKLRHSLTGKYRIAFKFISPTEVSQLDAMQL